MKPIRISPIASLLAFCLAGPASAPANPEAPAPTPRPKVEVAFVLDTTGSMSGLIEGAKDKIWSIADEIVSWDSRPDVAFALIAYRDRGDDYITRVSDLSGDIDAVYGELIRFQAAGGGDSPESVNQALNESVHKLAWSADAGTLRLIFLVGDAPPHMDYPDDIPFAESCETAVSKGIIINTIQCGEMGGTREFWEEIARLGGGEYVAIQQSGGMKKIRTPYDERISALNSEMAATVIPYGDLRAQRSGSLKVANSVAAEPEAVSDRLRYLSSRISDSDGSAAVPVAISGNEDLVNEVANKGLSLDEVETDQLPDELRELSQDGLKELIAEKTAARLRIQEELNALLAERRDYLATLSDESPETRDGFDEKVKELLRHQNAERAESTPR